MLICRLTIENYKSIRNLVLEPKELTVLIGANASGKSNLAECFDFISEVYRHGLEVAIARKGGYENIAHRKVQRSKASVKIHLIAEHIADERFLPPDVAKELGQGKIRVEHSFSFATKGSSIKAEFEVENELLILSVFRNEARHDIMQIVRKGSEISYRVISEEEVKKTFPGVTSTIGRRFFSRIPDFHFLSSENKRLLLPLTDLVVVQAGRFVPLLREFLQGMGGIRVYQISPNKSREIGVPTPRPELDRTGANLPAVIDSLKKRNVEIWNKILSAMRRVLPGLDEIEVAYTTSRTLGLFFHERAVGRPWSVEEISDGTIQTLCLLVAIFDPKNALLVLEEPENSIHPWIIRNILDACSEASTKKQIIITTHSPVVIDHVTPEKVWVMWRSQGESRVERLTALDKDFTALWESGDVATFEVLDSGAISEAIPPDGTSERKKE